jgi:predicted transcriptional regulator of viral defense system
MSKGNYLAVILRSPKTVFSSKDISLLWSEASTAATRVRLNYFVKKGDLYRIRKGLYAKDENYNKLELATRILIPSYVSFETVLAKEGLIFQYYEPVFIASYATRQITINQQVYSFRKIKNTVLMNSEGIEHVNETSIAKRERAFLDMIYINANYHFDNIRSINWDMVFEILPIYNNQKMAKNVKNIYKKAKQQTP